MMLKKRAHHAQPAHAKRKLMQRQQHLLQHQFNLPQTMHHVLLGAGRRL
jgi:hypothetical protein